MGLKIENHRILNKNIIELIKGCFKTVILISHLENLKDAVDMQIVIDRDKNGGELGKQVIDNGWELSFVDKRAADANDSVVKFGLPYTVYTLLKNATKTLTTDSSKTLLNLGVLEARLGKFK